MRLRFVKCLQKKRINELLPELEVSSVPVLLIGGSERDMQCTLMKTERKSVGLQLKTTIYQR